jgi:hypothetical protein
MPDPPTPRRGEVLPIEHPLVHGVIRSDRRQSAKDGDCIADVDPAVLEDMAAWHDGDELPTTEVDPGELV